MPVNAFIQDYPHRLGGHCGSGAMRDLLHWHGLGWMDRPMRAWSSRSAAL